MSFYWGKDSPNAPGNKGKSGGQPERDEVSTSIGRYFRSVGCPSGKSDGWSSTQFLRAPVRSVSLDSLIATQGGLVRRRIVKYLNRSSHEAVFVEEQNGRYYLWEGHHRAAAARLKGRSSIRAHVIGD